MPDKDQAAVFSLTTSTVKVPDSVKTSIVPARFWQGNKQKLDYLVELN